MPYTIPETYDVVRGFTGHDGTVYSPGEQIDGAALAHMRKSDQLLSRRFVIPTPDPHLRRTWPPKPTPTSLPATVRKQVTAVPPVPTGIVVTPDPEINFMNIGDTIQFTSQVLPAGADQSVTWYSGMFMIVEIDDNGLATCLQYGGCSLTCTSVADPSIKEWMTVQCIPESIVASPDPASCTVGGTVALTFDSVPDGGGTPLYVWEITPTSVATINSSGVVTGVSVGTATATVKLAYEETIFDTCVVNVTAAGTLQTEEEKPKRRRR